MNRAPKKVNDKNLRRLCWVKHYPGVAGLARAIGRHRTTIHRAVKAPEKYASTYALIEGALL